MFFPGSRFRERYRLGAGCKLSVHKTFRRRHVCMFNLSPVPSRQNPITIWLLYELLLFYFQKEPHVRYRVLNVVILVSTNYQPELMQYCPALVITTKLESYSLIFKDFIQVWQGGITHTFKRNEIIISYTFPISLLTHPRILLLNTKKKNR